jgi:DNA-binding transcriptional LysR family regulator
MATQSGVGDLELSLLRTFLAVVRFGTLARTAAAFEISQPAVSQQMFRLERIVGQKLFARERRGMALTRHGDLLISYANRAVELNEETLARLSAESGPKRIAVGMATDVGMVRLAPTLKRFQSVHPNVDVKVVVGALSRLETLLNRGKLDLIIGNPSLIAAPPAATYVIPLEWAASEDLQIDKSQPAPLVLFENPCAWQDEMLESLRVAGWDWQVIFESGSVDAVVTVVQSGLGMAALPASMIRNSRLVSLENTGLPSAPLVQFGLYRREGSTGETYDMLEQALAAAFFVEPV